jgi:hypothetical protein
VYFVLKACRATARQAFSFAFKRIQEPCRRCMAHMNQPHSAAIFKLTNCKQSKILSSPPKHVAFGVAFHIKRFAFAI